MNQTKNNSKVSTKDNLIGKNKIYFEGVLWRYMKAGESSQSTKKNILMTKLNTFNHKY